MNQVFDMKRWLLFSGKHWNENKKRNLLGLLALFGLMVIWFSLVLLVEPQSGPYPYPMQTTTYFIGLFVFGLLYSSFMFSDLADSPKGIHYLLTPASLFEKLLTAFIFSSILFFICYTLLFYGVDIVMVKLANSLEYKYNARAPYVQKVINIFNSPPEQEDKVYFFFLLVYINLQLAFLLGSVYFARYTFIKTAISLLLVFLFFMFFGIVILNGMMPKGSWLDSTVGYNIQMKGHSEVVRLPNWIGDVLTFLFKYTLAPFFLLVAYFRLKEKEV